MNGSNENQKIKKLQKYEAWECRVQKLLTEYGYKLKSNINITLVVERIIGGFLGTDLFIDDLKQGCFDEFVKKTE
jgi:hypothetical protein